MKTTGKIACLCFLAWLAVGKPAGAARLVTLGSSEFGAYPFWGGPQFTGMAGGGKFGIGYWDCGPNADCAGFMAYIDLTHYSADLVTGLYVPQGISPDGRIVTGMWRQQPAIWTRTGGQQLLGPLPLEPYNYDTGAVDVSVDGKTVVGQFDGLPFVSTENQGFVSLTSPGRKAVGVSDDGSVVAINGTDLSYRWTRDTGYQALDMLPGSVVQQAAGISADGQTIIGYGRHWNETGDHTELHAIRWRSGEPALDLGRFEPVGVTADGATIVGNSYESPGNGFLQFPMIWTQDKGARDINRYVQDELMLPLDGLQVTQVVGISDDGQTLLGRGFTNGSMRYWILQMGTLQACDMNGDGACDTVDIDAWTSAQDTFSFVSSFDLNQDDRMDSEDRRIWVEDLQRTYFGDANLDGLFNSEDLVNVFQAGQYEDGVAGNSTWSTGDWDADGEFTSSDMVMAFGSGGYENGPRAAVAAVPEPTTLALVIASLCGLLRLRTRR